MSCLSAKVAGCMSVRFYEIFRILTIFFAAFSRCFMIFMYVSARMCNSTSIFEKHGNCKERRRTRCKLPLSADFFLLFAELDILNHLSQTSFFIIIHLRLVIFESFLCSTKNIQVCRYIRNFFEIFFLSQMILKCLI